MRAHPPSLRRGCRTAASYRLQPDIWYFPPPELLVLKHSEDVSTPVIRRHRSQIHQWQAPLIVAFGLLVGSAIPLPSRYNPDFGLCGPDKVLHATGHMVLTATLLSAIQISEEGSTPRTAVAAVVVSSAYGVGTELLQERIPGREFEWGDLLAGVLGSVGGVLCWYLAEEGR